MVKPVSNAIVTMSETETERKRPVIAGREKGELLSAMHLTFNVRNLFEANTSMCGMPLVHSKW